MPPTKKPTDETITIPQITMENLSLALIGTQPLMLNSMSAKAKRDLLLGSKRKTSAEKQLIKHNPVEEFREAMTIIEREDFDSLLQFSALGIKSAMATAALEVPGVTKTKANRLIFVPGEYIPIYGIPRIYMNVMRSADMNRTPDIRTRAIVWPWATLVSLDFATPAFNRTSIATLAHNAGTLIGLGDSRQEKGKGSFGTFRVASADELDKLKEDLGGSDLVRLQREAIETPVPYDSEAENYLRMFEEEVASRS